MDQKKTLWILIATGIFLAVVIGAAVMISGNLVKNEPKIETLGSSDYWISSNPTVPSDGFSSSSSTGKTIKPAPVEPAVSNTAASYDEKPVIDLNTIAVKENDSETSPYANSAQGYAQTENLTVIANGSTNIYSSGETSINGVTTIDLNTLKSSQPAVTANNSVAQTAIEETYASKAKEVPAPKQNVKPAAKTVAKAETKPAKKTEAKPAKKAAPAVKKIDQFWVQAASYATKKNADEARTLLDENGIQCEVFTYKDSKEKLFYRVRVGPYTTKAEAEYWRGRIESIDLFKKSGSFVTSTSITQ